MTWLARSLLGLLSLAVVVSVLAWATGPRAPVDREISFDPAVLPDDLDAWLAAREAMVPDLRPEAAKRIVWAGDTGARTPLSVVYLHGFSASAGEIRPVPDDVAAALGANLYFARLTGHGRDGPAMAEAQAGDWVEDLAEAVGIGRRLGERVLLIGTSMGGALAVLAAHDPSLRDGLAGLVLISPNFAINNAAAPLLNGPWAERYVPAILGQERGFTPINTGHALHWTTRYPSQALVPMAALTDHVRALDPGAADLPALFLYSEHDKVVSPGAVRDVHAGWGGPKDLQTFVMDPGDDPYSHVIAGDVMSPGQTARAVSLIADWAAGL